MRVRATVLKSFTDQGIEFPKDAIFIGETEGNTVTFEPGKISSFRHSISKTRFSIKEDRPKQERDRDEDIRQLPKVYVTPKRAFMDQTVNFIPSSSIQGFYDGTNELIHFPTGAVSAYRHSIPFSKFKENLKYLYEARPEKPAGGEPSPGKPGEETNGANTPIV